jgi:hypothetical protein
MQELYKNKAEIIWQGANGAMVDPKPAGKFGVQVNIVSGSGRDGKWQQIDYPKEFDRNIKLHNPCIVKGKRYIIPTDWHLAEIGGVIGWGSSLKDAAKMVQEIAKEIKGPTLECPAEDIIELAEKELEKSAALGLEMI